MALTATTLNGAVGANDLTVRLTSGTGIAVGNFIKIDSEYLRVNDISQSPVIGVQRGQLGTLAVAHSTLAAAVFGPSADFSDQQQTLPRVYTYGVDGAIAIAPGLAQLVKATAGAYTIAAPARDQDGLTIVITSLTDAAHVITAPSAIINDGTAEANTTLTFAAVAGASVTLIAERGGWNTSAIVAVTPAP